MTRFNERFDQKHQIVLHVYTYASQRLGIAPCVNKAARDGIEIFLGMFKYLQCFFPSDLPNFQSDVLTCHSLIVVDQS